jgi:tRNA1Val (adenine37-N6)-methyltransferase
MEQDLLKPGERIDDLQRRGFRIIQHPGYFRFGTDSVLLADFARTRRGDRVADLCCGAGAVALLMLARRPEMRVVGIELLPELADMAARSAILNGLSDRLAICVGDVRDAHATLGRESFTLCVCNPPYFKAGAALLTGNEALRVARHEGALTPSDIAGAAARLLRTGGRFAVIYPAPRALEMMRAMEDAGIAPKRVRTVSGVVGRPPKHILIDGVKGAGEGLHFLEPLYLNERDGTPTVECRKIYGE